MSDDKPSPHRFRVGGILMDGRLSADSLVREEIAEHVPGIMMQWGHVWTGAEAEAITAEDRELWWGLYCWMEAMGRFAERDG